MTLTDASPVIDVHNHFIPPQLYQNGSGKALRVTHIDGEPDAIYAGEQKLGPVNLGLLDVGVQLADMERIGLDLRALAIPPYLSRYDLSAEAGATWTRRVNEALAEVAAGHPFLPIATVPLQDGEQAARELGYAVETLGMYGVQILTHVNGTDLDDPRLASFWETAAALNTPVFIHPSFVRGDHFYNGYFLRNLIGNPTETTIAGARLLFAGLFDRLPTLKVMLSHGGGTLPYLLGRLTHGYYHEPSCREDTPIPPNRRVACFYYDTVLFEPKALKFLIDQVGADQVVLGTDHPFPMGEHDPLGLAEKLALDAATARSILCKAPAALLGLDVSTVPVDG